MFPPAVLRVKLSKFVYQFFPELLYLLSPNWPVDDQMNNQSKNFFPFLFTSLKIRQVPKLFCGLFRFLIHPVLSIAFKSRSKLHSTAQSYAVVSPVALWDSPPLSKKRGNKKWYLHPSAMCSPDGTDFFTYFSLKGFKESLFLNSIPSPYPPCYLGIYIVFLFNWLVFVLIVSKTKTPNTPQVLVLLQLGHLP